MGLAPHSFLLLDGDNDNDDDADDNMVEGSFALKLSSPGCF